MITALLAGILIGAVGRDLWPTVRRRYEDDDSDRRAARRLRAEDDEN